MSSRTTRSQNPAESLSKVFRSEHLRKRFEQSLKRARKEKILMVPDDTVTEAKKITRAVEYDPNTDTTVKDVTYLDGDEQITIEGLDDQRIKIWE